jgi:Phosphoglycerate dehydrogenase and related dehydrogenases
MDKAIFMSANPGALDFAYASELRELMGEKLDFLPQLTDFSSESLQSRRDELACVRYIFSTWGMPSFSDENIAEFLPNLEAVFYAAGSVQYFARPFIGRGVRVFSAWHANGIPVAEFTAAQIILAAKGYFQRLKCGSRESWDNRSCAVAFQGNYDTKIGIIGAGMIGREVIKLLRAYRLDILVWDKFLTDTQIAELGAVKASLEYIFSECAVISNHLANNAQTRGLLTGALFSSMRSGAAFINTGRGAQIDEPGLIAALKAVPTRVALLDVTDPEPPAPGSDLYRLPNVFLSPHIAGSIGSETRRMGEYMFAEYNALATGKPTHYEVSSAMLDTMA